MDIDYTNNAIITMQHHLDAANKYLTELAKGYRSVEKQNTLLDAAMKQVELCCIDMRNLCEKERPTIIIANTHTYNRKEIYGEVPLGPGGNQYVSPAEHARVFTVTSTNTELDFTAKIFNELAKSPSGYSGDNWWKEEIQLDYFQKGDTKSMDIYLRSLENSTWDIGAGIDALNQGFKNTVVFDSMFWKKKGLTPEAAINSLAGTYDKTINDLFNK